MDPQPHRPRSRRARRLNPRRGGSRQGWLGQRDRLGGEAAGREASLRVRRNIGGAREIGFARRVQSGHPAPRERVGGGIAVEQVPEKKVGSEFPRKPEGEDPDAREPHARVIVEPAGGDELAGPLIEALDPGPAGHRIGIARRRGEAEGGKGVPIARPRRGLVLERAFPVRAPGNLLHKFLRPGPRQGHADRRNDLLLRHQAPLQIG